MLAAVVFPLTAEAQTSPAPTLPEPSAQQVGEEPTFQSRELVTFLTGAALGLTMHESGHLLFDTIFDAQPRLVGVHFGVVPFFAISHRPNLSPRREFTISSAGFWVQSATSEWLLTARPQLRQEDAPFLKGIFAFNVLNSIGYSFVALAKSGPIQRDTRGMADSLGVDERTVAIVVLAPAVLDAWRYFRPDARAPRWAARITKMATVLLVIKGR